VFALKWPPTIRATGASKKIKSPELGKHTALQFLFYFSWNHQNKANILAPSDQPNSKTSSLHKLWNFAHALK
jgi:hypothetical protein